MAEVGVYEAKTKLPRLLDEVAKGRRCSKFGKGRRLGRLSLRAAIAKGRR